MNTRFLMMSATALSAAAVLSLPAIGQSLDYSAMSDLFGEAVTAGATGAPQRSSDVPATMIIITRDDIARSPEFDIPGLLRHYAGINHNRFGFGDSQVSIRGEASGYMPRLLVLVNGREVYLDSYGYTAWSTLPVQLEEIQQIEVVKGPQSALYGFNAVSGVVNIITRNPDFGDWASARVNVGDGGYGDVSLTAGRRLGERASVRFSYGNAGADEFDPVESNTFAVSLADGDFSRETAAIEGRFQLSDNIRLIAEATTSEVELQELTSIYYTTRSLYELTSYKVDVEADTDFGFLTLSGYRNETEIAYDFGPSSNELTAFRVQNLFKLGTSDTVRLSAEYREGTTVSFPDPGNGGFGYETTAFSAMWNHKFSNAVDLTLAGRFDNVEWSRDGDPNPALYIFSQEDYDVSFEEFSYNAALVWRPQSGGAVRFSASRGIQAPSMFDIGFTLFTTSPIPLAITGNPNIETSVVTAYEVAYDRAISPTVDLRAAVFMQDTSDVRGTFGAFPDILPPAAPVPVLLFNNRGDTQTTGAEISLTGNPDGPWNWGVNYTYQSVDDDLDTFGLFTALDFESATPEHLANAHVGWTGERFTADAYLNYVSGTTSPFQPEFGTLTRYDLDASLAASFRAGYRISDHVNVSLNAQNANFGSGEITNVNYQPASRTWLQLSTAF
ncbi:TonB-dependent receptor [Maricaulis sp.]|uniref:TonB-dependent receptor plug domain-containing protein n=1 Tax=Maricaulis sp. TaxID=1486257 RepID=UPI002616AFFC|nr:TonB-dependent receptor [Maricaulis sp.]